MIDYEKLRDDERHLVKPHKPGELEKLIAQVREVAGSIGYSRPRLYGDLTAFGRILEMRGVHAPSGKPWVRPGHGAPTLQRFLRLHVRELDFPLERESTTKPQATTEPVKGGILSRLRRG